MTKLRASLWLVLAFGAALGLAGLAAAQGAPSVVIVEARTAEGGPADTQVTLTQEGGAGSPRSCRTTNGTCRITGVPAGRYVVSAQPRPGHQPPIPRVVPVPAGTEVTVRVTLP